MAKKTPATQAMEKSGQSFAVLEYDYDPNAASIGLHAAQSLGLSPSIVFKTLMVMAVDEPLIAIVPSDKELNLKALAQASGRKSVAMMKPSDAERLSGYKVGGISPLGQKKRLRIFLDDSALSLPFIVINGGQRGLQIQASPTAILTATQAITAPLAC